MSRVVVGIKRVIDHSVRVHLHAQGGGVVTDGVKMSINPFCEIAIEQALRIREQGLADEVVVVSIGPAEVEQQLRSALAMGADRAIRVAADTALEPLTVARTLLGIVEREAPRLVLLGKQAIDADNNQTGQMLAALWDRPQATFTSELKIDESKATVTREIDQGLEVLEIDLPAVITVDLRLNEPRYVKLPQLLKAKKQPVEPITLAELGIVPTKQFHTKDTAAPSTRVGGTTVTTVSELISELEQRGLI